MTRPRVLVVDDDPNILASLQRGLQLSGFETVAASDGKQALAMTASERPDAMVLDITMPILDGVTVVSALRALGDEVPICVLSARSEVTDRIAGLEAGADDYLTKPFELDELVARLRALLRRTGNGPGPETVIRIGEVAIDLNGRRVQVAGTAVELTRREFDLLAALAENRGRVLSRTQLLESVWGYDFPVRTNVLDVFVSYLRKKLEDSGSPRIVHTVRGVGYVVREKP